MNRQLFLDITGAGALGMSIVLCLNIVLLLLLLSGCTSDPTVVQHVALTPVLPTNTSTIAPTALQVESTITPNTAPITATRTVPTDPTIAALNDVARSTCPVTSANKNTPPGEQSNDLQYGNGELWTELWPHGTVLIRPGDIQPNGWLAMKFPWWRSVEGQLRITGHRLDADAPQVKADIPAGYGDIGFQATAIYFPTEGCWEVTGMAGEAELTFVTLVMKTP